MNRLLAAFLSTALLLACTAPTVHALNHDEDEDEVSEPELKTKKKKDAGAAKSDKEDELEVEEEETPAPAPKKDAGTATKDAGKEAAPTTPPPGGRNEQCAMGQRGQACYACCDAANGGGYEVGVNAYNACAARGGTPETCNPEANNACSADAKCKVVLSCIRASCAAQ